MVGYKMRQQQINKIKGLVNELGLIGTLNIFGGEKEIVRQVYIDNPESYLDYLIDNLTPMESSGYVKKAWTYYLKKNIFLIYEDNQDIVTVDDYIWNYFYRGIMQFDNTKIESIFTEWFYKHIPELSEKKPISYSDMDDINRRWKHSGLLDDIQGLSNINEKTLRGGPDYMIVSSSMADYIKLSRSVADSYNSINDGDK